MDEYESLSHSKWECKYHVVFVPKCRRKTLYLTAVSAPNLPETGMHLGQAG
jgi:REP element-mobilizing transposase RayT